MFSLAGLADELVVGADHQDQTNHHENSVNHIHQEDIGEEADHHDADAGADLEDGADDAVGSGIIPAAVDGTDVGGQQVAQSALSGKDHDAGQPGKDSGLGHEQQQDKADDDKHEVEDEGLTGYEHEAWNLGDYVRVEDKELGLSVTTRIVRREYNLQEPWNTVLELSTTLKNLGSSVSSIDTIADALEGTSMVSNNDIRELVPFNHLRNSRADDGLAYWVSSGFEADGENGASGTASFKAEGVAGMTKSLAQTVYPSNRSSYTLSAQIASDNLEKLSDDAQVGIEVVIEYEDGSTETRFIDLY